MTYHKSHQAKTSFYLPTPSPFPDKNSCLEKTTKILNKCRRTSFLYAKGGTSIALLHGSFCTQNWDQLPSRTVGFFDDHVRAGLMTPAPLSSYRRVFNSSVTQKMSVLVILTLNILVEFDVDSYKEFGVYQQNLGCRKITDCIKTLFFL